MVSSLAAKLDFATLDRRGSLIAADCSNDVAPAFAAPSVASMGRSEKLLQKVLLGRSDASLSFSDLRQLLTALGFAERIRGDHHIFTRSGIAEIVNIQPIGSKAKAYQVRQVRGLILKYKLGAQDEG